MELKKQYYKLKKEELDAKSLYWLERAERMAERRSYFEEMWRENLYALVAHINTVSGYSKQFNPDESPEIQQYYANQHSGGFHLSDVRYPLEFAVIMRKLATESKNIPQPDWMVMDDDDQSSALLFKSIYEGIMHEEVGVEYQEMELLLGKNIFGTSITWSRLVAYEHIIKEPQINEQGVVDFVEKTVKVRKFQSDNMDLRHVLIDEGCKRADLADCEDCIVFEYYSEDKAKKEFSYVDFDELGIKAVPLCDVFQSVNEQNGGGNKPVFEAMHCYNKIQDEYTILINGKTVRTSPIVAQPYCGEKDLPITIFVDHKIPGQPYGYGEPSIVKAFRETKNKNRNMIHDITGKTGKPTLVVSPAATFDEENYFWNQDFIRAEPDQVKPLLINANLQAAVDLDERTDADVVMVTGININDTTSPNSDETATKTVVRKESQVALIDLGMRVNMACGFKRWHRVNACIILPHLKSPNFDKDGKEVLRKVVTKDKQLFNIQDQKLQGEIGKFTMEEKPGVYIFQYKGESLDYDFRPVLKMGNIVISDQLEKNITLEGLEALARLAPNVVNQEYLGSEIIRLFNFKDTAIKKQEESAVKAKATTPEDEVNKIIQQAGGVIPENQQLINQFKNAKEDQGVVEDAARPKAMGVPGESVSIPVAR